MSDFSMPSAEVGEWVLYQPHADAALSPALVVEAASRTLTLWAVSGAYGGQLKPSVHHVTDPGVNEFPDWKRYGLWQHKPRDPKVAVLTEKVALLEKKVADLEGRKKG